MKNGLLIFFTAFLISFYPTSSQAAVAPSGGCDLALDGGWNERIGSVMSTCAPKGIVLGGAAGAAAGILVGLK